MGNKDGGKYPSIAGGNPTAAAVELCMFGLVQHIQPGGKGATKPFLEQLYF